MVFHNDYAVMGMPMYLLVAVVTASAIIGIFALSIFQMVNDSQTDSVKKQIERIVTEAENMFEYASTGSKVTVQVDFPSSMSFCVFGSMPENTISEPTDFTLDASMSNNYYFAMSNGEICSYSSNARFCSEDTTEFSVLNQGSYKLSLELVTQDDATYVKIY